MERKISTSLYLDETAKYNVSSTENPVSVTINNGNTLMFDKIYRRKTEIKDNLISQAVKAIENGQDCAILFLGTLHLQGLNPGDIMSQLIPDGCKGNGIGQKITYDSLRSLCGFSNLSRDVGFNSGQQDESQTVTMSIFELHEDIITDLFTGKATKELNKEIFTGNDLKLTPNVSQTYLERVLDSREMFATAVKKRNPEAHLFVYVNFIHSVNIELKMYKNCRLTLVELGQNSRLDELTMDPSWYISRNETLKRLIFTDYINNINNNKLCVFAALDGNRSDSTQLLSTVNMLGSLQTPPKTSPPTSNYPSKLSSSHEQSYKVMYELYRSRYERVCREFEQIKSDQLVTEYHVRNEVSNEYDKYVDEFVEKYHEANQMDRLSVQESVNRKLDQLTSYYQQKMDERETDLLQNEKSLESHLVVLREELASKEREKDLLNDSKDQRIRELENELSSVKAKEKQLLTMIKEQEERILKLMKENTQFKGNNSNRMISRQDPKGTYSRFSPVKSVYSSTAELKSPSKVIFGTSSLAPLKVVNFIPDKSPIERRVKTREKANMKEKEINSPIRKRTRLMKENK